VTAPVAIAGGLSLLGGGGTSAAADMQSVLLLGLSRCGAGTSLGGSKGDESSDARSRLVYPVEWTVNGEAAARGLVGSSALVGSVWAMQAVGVAVLRGSVPEGPHRWSEAAAKVKFPAMSYRLMTLLLPGMAMGGWEQVLGTSGGPEPRGLVGTIVAIFALCSCTAAIVTGLRLLYTETTTTAPATTDATQQSPAATSSTQGQSTSALPAVSLHGSRPTGFAVAFATWPRWAQEWVAPPYWWSEVAFRQQWGVAFTGCKAEHRWYTTVVQLRGVLLGLLYAWDWGGNCTALGQAVAVVLGVHAMATLGMRPLRYRVLNAANVATQGLAAGAVLAVSMKADAAMVNQVVGWAAWAS